MSRINPIECVEVCKSGKAKRKGTIEAQNRGEEPTNISNCHYKNSELQFAKRLLDFSRQRRSHKRNVLLEIEQQLGESNSYNKINE
jgi:hypothetical protein